MKDHGKAKGEAYKLVKEKKVEGDPMTYKGSEESRPKDRDSVAMAEGMSSDFPTSPNHDRYKLASSFRVKAIKRGMGE